MNYLINEGARILLYERMTPLVNLFLFSCRLLYTIYKKKFLNHQSTFFGGFIGENNKRKEGEEETDGINMGSVCSRQLFISDAYDR
jgi:hypothetical protein